MPKWDGKSICVEEGCIQPATCERLIAVNDDGTPIVEMVCERHDMTDDEAPPGRLIR